MKKRCSSFLMAAVLTAVCALPVSAGIIPAQRQEARLVDEADLLSDSQEEELLGRLDAISEAHQCDVAVVTQESIGSQTAQAAADDFYDYNGYGMREGDDGILFLIAMKEREWAITTHGSAIPSFTDAGQEYMTDQIVPYLSDGDYETGFNTFADLCEDFLIQAETGNPYDVENLPTEPFSPIYLPMSLGVGLILGFISVSIMKGQMKTVRFKAEASDYMKKDSLNITRSNEMFLYSKVDRVEKPKDSDGGSSTHTSSSGETHGGSSGSF